MTATRSPRHSAGTHYTLSGGAAILMRQFKANAAEDHDTAGVIADRLEDYPHECDNEACRVRLVACLRSIFIDRKGTK